VLRCGRHSFGQRMLWMIATARRREPSPRKSRMVEISSSGSGGPRLGNWPGLPDRCRVLHTPRPPRPCPPFSPLRNVDPLLSASVEVTDADWRCRNQGDTKAQDVEPAGHWPRNPGRASWMAPVPWWAAALCQTTSRSKSASSRGAVIIASWPVGNFRRRHPAPVGGSALLAKRPRMSERKKPPPVQSM
jgi:hypothetical protein